MSLIRTFLALPLPKNVQNYVSEIPIPRIDTRDKINWVKAKNIHITLSFLGDTEESTIQSQAEDIEALIASYGPMELGITDTGVFPHANEPRVLWVGAAPYDSSLQHFKSDLDKLLIKHGYRVDNRKFQPHITLGRVKTISRKSSFIHDYLITDVRDTSFEVNEVWWLKSTLTPEGAVYEKLKVFKFKQGDQQ